MIHDLAQLENLDAYRKHFMDSTLWQAHVQAVCRRHGLLPCQQVRAGLAGSFPTFIVEERWVVKFYGRLFRGELAFETELQVNRILPPDLAVPVPAVLNSGCLLDESATWRWPYLIFEYLPGISIGEVFEQVNFEDKLALASVMGKFTRQVQRLALDGAPLFHTSLDAYTRFFHDQREKCLANHRQWQSLPGHLIDQLDEYLLPVETLVDPLVPFGLIHADITRDHILGRLEAGRWVTLGLIDFGDARVGNIFYDLAALHIDLFRCDKRLLQAYLDAYGLEDQRQFAHKAMSVALLHEFNIFSLLGELYSHYRQNATLSELADILWDVKS